MSVRCWPHFSSAFQVEKVLTLHELSSSTLHHTQGCSALDGQGLQPGLEKLYEMILKRKKMLRHSKKKRWGGGTEAVLAIKMTLWTTICLRMFSADMSVTLLELQSVKPEGNLLLQTGWDVFNQIETVALKSVPNVPTSLHPLDIWADLLPSGLFLLLSTPPSPYLLSLRSSAERQ